MLSRRAILVEPRKFQIIKEDITPGAGELLIKIAVCGLCNWELNHWRGHLGECPQALGHEWAGTVVELGAGVSGFQVGDVVTGLTPVLNGFADYAVYNHAECMKIKPELNPQQALGEPLKCIVTVLRATAPEFGDVGVVFGCGPMGLWCIQGLSGNLLAGLIAVDIDERKLELAKKYGAKVTINPKTCNVEERIREITGGNMADFAIEGTGSPSVINNALSVLKSRRGRLILMSSYEAEAAPMNLKMAMEKSIELKVAHPGFSMDQVDDVRRAATALNNEVFQNQEIISHVFSLDNIQTAFETLEHKPADYLKGVVVP